MPRESVWSRRIGKGLEWSPVAETFQAGSIVVVNEAVEEGIAVGMRLKEPMRDASFRLPTNGINDPPIEAFDKSVGLRPIGFGQPVTDLVLSADEIEGMPAGRPVIRFVLHVDGKAVGEFAAVVGENGVNGIREVGEEAIEEPGGGLAIALGVDLQIDIAGGPVDRHEGVAFTSLQRRQVLDIDMNEPDGRLLEHADRGLGRLGPPVEAVTNQAAVNGATGELAVDAAPHHFGDVVERQSHLRPQLTDQRFLHG